MIGSDLGALYGNLITKASRKTQNNKRKHGEFWHGDILRGGCVWVIHPRKIGRTVGYLNKSNIRYSPVKCNNCIQCKRKK